MTHTTGAESAITRPRWDATTVREALTQIDIDHGAELHAAGIAKTALRMQIIDALLAEVEELRAERRRAIETLITAPTLGEPSVEGDLLPLAGAVRDRLVRVATRDAALRALGEWVDANYSEILLALGARSRRSGDRCDVLAIELATHVCAIPGADEAKEG